MGNNPKDKDKLFYTRVRNLTNKQEDLRSLQVRGYLQEWFPMEVGLGWVWDDKTKQYVVH